MALNLTVHGGEVAQICPVCSNGKRSLRMHRGESVVVQRRTTVFGPTEHRLCSAVLTCRRVREQGT